MRKAIFILVALVLAISVALIGCPREGPEAPTAIKIGLVRDTDGTLSAFECGYGGSAYRWFVRTQLADGIYLSDYGETLPVEIITREFDPLDWGTLTDETEYLINTAKVHFMWGGPGTDCIFTQARICNDASMLLLTLEGGASSLIWDEKIDEWPYVWVSLSFSNWYQIPTLYQMLKDEGVAIPKCAVSHIGGPGATHGQEYLQECVNNFGEANVIDLGAHAFYPPLSPEDADAVIEAAKTALGNPADPNYHVLVFATYPWQVYALTSAIIADGELNCPAIVFGPGANTGEYGAAFGPMVNGVCSYVVAVEETSTAVANAFAGIAAQIELDWEDPDLPACDKPAYVTNGTQCIDYWGHPCYVAALQMWKKALENAGSVDTDEVKAELRKFSPTNPCTTILGPTWFHVFGDGYGGGILDYECHPGEIGQWQQDNGGVKYEIVGGNDPTGDFIYPMTDRWSWLS